MMLIWVLVVTALLVSDVAGTHNCLELERTQCHHEKREISRGPCDEEWFYFPALNSCYRFFTNKKTWEEAKDFCNQDTHCGQLASVTSSEHNCFISKVISIVDKTNPFTWIGLNDICKEGNLTWIDGTPYTYRRWAGGQPDNYRDKEDCVHIYYLNWNDLPCDEKLSFICAYKLC